MKQRLCIREMTKQLAEYVKLALMHARRANKKCLNPLDLGIRGAWDHGGAFAARQRLMTRDRSVVTNSGTGHRG